MNGVGIYWRIWLCAWGAVLIGCADAHAAAAYEPAPFSHYQPILDRMPFGTPPAVSGPVNPDLLEQQRSEELLQATQEQIAKQIAFTALNVTPRGRTAVGFIDRSVNPPENYYLEVGASAQGWTVLDADYAANWAQFEKDGVTITMHLHKGLIDGPPSEGTNNASAPPQAPPAAPLVVSEPPPMAAKRPSVPGLVRLPKSARTAPQTVPTQTAAATADAAADSTSAPAKSYLERLRERKAQEAADQKAAEKAARENLQELARKVAQDELAKREKEQAEALEQLRAQQELLQVQQELEAQAQQAEQPPDDVQPQEAAPDPDAEPVPEEK